MRKERQRRLASFRLARLSKPTLAENAFANILHSLSIRFIKEKGFLARGRTCIVDFYIPKPYKLCVEIDGGYHNSWPQRKLDDKRTEYLVLTRGFRVIRFTNEEVLDNPTSVTSKLVNLFCQNS